MGERLSNWFSLAVFQPWKLQTTWDYLFFGILLLLVVLAIFLILGSRKKHRTQEDATRKVAKKLQSLGGKGSVCYIGKMVKTTDMEHFCELINVAKDRIYVVNDGAIEDSGTHEELLSHHGLYEKMWKAHMEVKDNG